MYLVSELKFSECDDTPSRFRERLIEVLQIDFPGRTIDDLVCNPQTALQYCETIRDSSNAPLLPDAVILKSLMNIRRRRDCPTGLKKARTRRNLRRELDQAGCEIEADQFKLLACDCLADMYKSRTIDEVVCYPREANGLCNYVRNQAGCQGLADELILSTIMNVRKSAGATN